jgi:hypothetical protein
MFQKVLEKCLILSGNVLKNEQDDRFARKNVDSSQQTIILIIYYKYRQKTFSEGNLCNCSGTNCNWFKLEEFKTLQPVMKK